MDKGNTAAGMTGDARDDGRRSRRGNGEAGRDEDDGDDGDDVESRDGGERDEEDSLGGMELVVSELLCYAFTHSNNSTPEMLMRTIE